LRIPGDDPCVNLVSAVFSTIPAAADRASTVATPERMYLFSVIDLYSVYGFVVSLSFIAYVISSVVIMNNRGDNRRFHA
jgi:hypothetical protein